MTDKIQEKSVIENNKMSDKEKEELLTLIASSSYKNLNAVGYLRAILGVSVIIAIVLLLLLIRGTQ